MKDNPQNLTDCIELIKDVDFPRMGRWEIAQRIDPITEKVVGKKEALILTMVAHEESYFILNTLIHPREVANRTVNALLEAICRNSAFPDTVLTKDKKIYEELGLIAKELNFKVILVDKLKASPKIFSDMTKILR